METLTRIERFEIARDYLMREYLQGFLTPEVFEQLSKIVADHFCSIVKQDKKEKEGEK